VLGIHYHFRVDFDHVLDFEGTDPILELSDLLSGENPEVFRVLGPFHDPLFLKMFSVGPGLPLA
jgi:hypothetical protein